MKRLNIKRILALIILLGNSVLLCLSFLYFLTGSLEMFPTEEKEDGVKLVMGTLSLLFALIEMGLIFLIIKLKSKF